MSAHVVVEQSTNYVEVSDNGQNVLVVEAGPQVILDQGRLGPPGPAGPPGPPGDSEATLAFVHPQVVPVLTVQILHGLVFQPAGVICIDSQGDVVEFGTITYPQVGVVELTFGVPFSGTVRLS
ncbi:hypothetical protein GCM10017691_23970 [Pseudonocardia petroleophila]|uniref:Uncharacterized protein n=1 Tax=Pseudonocardia petroleophila TaxID=37331 RepID=A0A7G7MFU6_9PSEU|nr:hypothetical protein [Pseudonocardia petroleophila]QNG51657.1 hypothetical protein H6H00_26715 [Pseudonocardia petroleophila]